MDLTEISTAAILLATLASLSVRLSPRTPPSYPPLVVCHLGAIALIALSQSWIFDPLDAALGGTSLVNLLSHCCMVIVLWTVTTMIAGPLLDDDEDPRVLRGAVLTIALVGTIVAFAVLSPEESSRGLDNYDHRPAYVAYQVFSLMPLWAPAFWMIPRLLHALGGGPFHRLQATYIAFLIAYSASVLCVLSYAAAAAGEWILPLRELLVVITGAAGMIGFFLVPLTTTKGSAGAVPDRRGT
ncbi:hypothetical protein JRG18_12225 [Kocuria palustris]|uniref:hypothetical protein n=1 Tax=Kocuria palustris TaxID=71999 RepID=UPI0019D25214|nr:hypothetical protein [Kocuria palustris]MBN6754277.1 hypothetical protein [Kocuria palustris]MBN6759220.1 hypothetical protein [Kocuria palustris]MBN6764260.1 hypothetical protein [Kocuria palustris]MBN6783745.1 hypothetical protein [Kocuria palustris]MBN6800227.1 hypothetical protein [Kocuria palustris]